MHGWAGRLFALVRMPTGVVQRFRDGEVRSEPSLDLLVERMSEGERRAIGIGRDEARASVALVGGARADLERALDYLGGPVPAEVVPRPPNLAASWSRAAREAGLAIDEGEPERARLILSEALVAQQHRGPLDLFTWSRDPVDVAAAVAAARALPTVSGGGLRGLGEGWGRVELQRPVAHPAGLAVDRAPIAPRSELGPEDGRAYRAWQMVANRASVFARMSEIGAPTTILEESGRALDEAVVELVERMHAPPRGNRPAIVPSGPIPLALKRPPPGHLEAVFRVPYTNPPLFVVQRPGALRVVSREGVLHDLPPSAWPPRFGSSRFVVFTDTIRTGAEPIDCAVLDVATGTWCETWPDGPGVDRHHTCALAETDGQGGHWLVDPRTASSLPIPGPVLAWLDTGPAALVHAPGGLAYVLPREGTVEPVRLANDSPAFRVDVWTAEVTRLDGVAQVAEAPDPPGWALCQPPHGEIALANGRALYIDGACVAVFDGPVLGVSVHGGNSQRRVHLAILGPDELLSYDVEAPYDEEEGSMTLDGRIRC